MGDFVSYLPRCPFYKSENKAVIRCEGVTETGFIFNDLHSKETLEAYKDLYCCCDWESCLIAKMLNSKYTKKE